MYLSPWGEDAYIRLINAGGTLSTDINIDDTDGISIESLLIRDLTGVGDEFVKVDANGKITRGPILDTDLPPAGYDLEYLRLDAANSPVTGRIDMLLDAVYGLTIENTNLFGSGLLVDTTASSHSGSASFFGFASEGMAASFSNDSSSAPALSANAAGSNRTHASFGGGLGVQNNLSIVNGTLIFEGTTGADAKNATLGTEDLTLGSPLYKLADRSTGTYILAQKTAAETFESNLSVNGNTTLGDASSDTVTINGRASFPNATSSGNSALFGADARLYRSAANILRTPDSFTVDVNLLVSGTTTVTGDTTLNGDTTLGNASSDTVTTNARQSWGNATSESFSLRIGNDVDIWDGGANLLSIGDNTHIRAGNLTVGLAGSTIGNILTDGFDSMNVTGTANGYPNNVNFQNSTGNTASGALAGSGSSITILGRGQTSPVVATWPTNYELSRIIMSNVVNGGDLTIDTVAGGTGTARNIQLTPGGGTVIANGTILASNFIRSNGATSGIGYATGAGGTVSQATNKSTGVTLNKVCGTITMNSAALAAGTIVSFTVTNSAVAATDTVFIQHDSAGTPGAYTITANTMAAGSFRISVRNNTAGSLSEGIVLRFAVIKAVTS